MFRDLEQAPLIARYARLGDSAGTETLRRSAAAEVAFATLVLLVTAVLVATPIEPPVP